MSTAPRAFRGLVCDIDRLGDGLAFLIQVDRHDVGLFMVAVGTPPGIGRATMRYELCPSVALLPCRTPSHPDRDELALAEAAIDSLIWQLESGLALTPGLAARFDALRAQLDGMPIHIMPAASADIPEEP